MAQTMVNFRMDEDLKKKMESMCGYGNEYDYGIYHFC